LDAIDRAVPGGLVYDKTLDSNPNLPLMGKEMHMVDLIKKAIYTGVGLAVLTKERAEELVKELSQQAKLSEQEGKELFDGLLKQSEHARNDLQSKLDDAVLAVVNRLNLATKDEVASLKAKVEELLTKLGQGPAGGTGA
jgi:polyhydroxyalkanoate synthesis regulator phasin